MADLMSEAGLPATEYRTEGFFTTVLNKDLNTIKKTVKEIEKKTCKKQVFDQQFSEKLDSADFGKLVLHIVIDKAVMRQRAAASLLGA
ncbi:MAG: hypothetical protein SPF15_00745 [Candidatus Cryptobacteroides sp.]|uniref:hypothetical protein n=1 Tax=Candidatus Cryptobacteroides sp. TaxID=2952915 RepID=UPI002A8358C9|nr:hypothetical protein [Candidatus Cryptobacteroides sp.]MDY5042522.1 hypothetical protein [Candidatus Cryptobacteroides sp.]